MHPVLFWLIWDALCELLVPDSWRLLKGGGLCPHETAQLTYAARQVPLREGRMLQHQESRTLRNARTSPCRRQVTAVQLQSATGSCEQSDRHMLNTFTGTAGKRDKGHNAIRVFAWMDRKTTRIKCNKTDLGSLNAATEGAEGAA
jgi:hypothetical protein